VDRPIPLKRKSTERILLQPHFYCALNFLDAPGSREVPHSCGAFARVGAKLDILQIIMALQHKQRILQFLAAFLLLVVCGGQAQDGYPAESWQKVASPEELGWSTKKLQAARQYADSIGSAAVVIVTGGMILDQWGDTTRRFQCHSIRKSFLSALYGIHVKRGEIKLSKTLQQLGIDDNEPSLTPVEKKASVADLLKARSGIYHPALYETPAMAVMRPPRGSHPPGTFWYYNNWDFNALGTIFEQETGTGIFGDFERRIARPLQMEDFRLEDTRYFRGEASIHAAYPFRMTARDMARFGLLYLRRGSWRGKEIVPEEWIAESIKSYSDAGESGGYGYMWWVAVNGRHFPNVRLENGTYSARGYGGHYVVVIPKRDLVIVHRANTDPPFQPVYQEDFGKLLKMILDSSPSAQPK
jgi:CubicO group peptidase (beta-lactamase class C family)